MSFPMRPVSLTDLLKNILQSTQATTPDNPSEVLNDYQAGIETVTIADVVTFPNLGHTGTYVYNDVSSMYGKGQYS